MPSARDVALDLITMFPTSIKVPLFGNREVQTDQIFDSIEINQYFHSSDVPRLARNKDKIRNGFHINVKTKESFLMEMSDAIVHKEN